ncbi:MAG TPA: hypothetical protein VE818_01770 [Nitrososphaeraceae archaeon]|nr:hypothetical protein [Nitrososphaeraceae archaeon]
MGSLSIVYNRTNQKRLIGILAIPVAVIILSLNIIYYPSLLPKTITSQNSLWIEQASYIFYTLLVGSLILMMYGFRCLCIKNPTTPPSSSLSTYSQSGSHFNLFRIVNSILSNKKYFRIFWPASIGYGIFYALVSGMILYKPEGLLYMHDSGGIAIPSVIITSYGPIGYVPIFSLYFTEYLGVLIIPINLLIAVFISSLVGVNVVISAYAFKNLKHAIANKSKGSTISLLGASIALFTACPTCATFYIFGSISASITSAIVSFAGLLDIIFLITSIPLLLVAILMTAATVRKITLGSCRVTK